MMLESEEYIQEAAELEELVTTVTEVGEFLKIITRHIETAKENDAQSTMLFRGQPSIDFSMDASIFRNGYLSRETKLINELILQEPTEFGSHMSDFEQLVKMQHYGLPTRLLDVTTNPLVGLYFTCCDNSCMDKDGEIIILIESLKRPTEKQVQYFAALAEYDGKSQEYFIDYFDQKGWLSKSMDYTEKREFLKNVFRNKYIPVVAPKNNERIKRQNGSFLLLGIDIEKEDYYLKNTFDLKPQLVKDFGDGIPRSFKVPADLKQSILKELDNIGINEAFVYPELEHQTSYIKRRNCIKAGE